MTDNGFGEIINLAKRTNVDPGDREVSALSQVGLTGLEHSGGYVTEEFHPKLSGDQQLRIYREMTDNDPIVGAILRAIDLLIRQVNWAAEAATDSPEDQSAAQFLDECMNDMSVSWHDTISEILSMLPFGWSFHEIIYKIRRGPDQEDGRLRSRYTDGRVGWRNLEIRAQNTRDRWEFDEDEGGITGMYQMAPPDYRLNYIPIEKGLLFRPEQHKGNPEGRSILRNAYRAWVMKKRFEEVEGIGMERDLAGLPVAYVDPKILRDDATPEEKAMLAAIKDIVRNIRRDEQEGVIWPLIYDERGNLLYDLKLLNSGGQRQFDVSLIIDRYDRRMAQSVLADFIMLGHESVGSFALSSSKTRLFAVALGAWLKSITSVLNRHAVPRLFELNGMKMEHLPRITHDDLEVPDLNEIADFISKLAGVGIIFDDEEVERHLRSVAKLPVQQREEEVEAEEVVEGDEEEVEGDADVEGDRQNFPLAKHYGPGIHEGTGTDQSAHGRGGGSDGGEMSRGMALAQWADGGKANGPAQEGVRALESRGITVTNRSPFGIDQEFDVVATQKVLSELPQAISDLEGIGISAYPDTIAIDNSSFLSPLGRVDSDGHMILFPNMIASSQGQQTEGFTIGGTSVRDVYIHELGHVIDVQAGQAIQSVPLYEKYGKIRGSRYSNSSYTESMEARGFDSAAIFSNMPETGDRGEYVAEAFTAAVLVELGEGGDNARNVNSDLRTLLLEEARKLSGPLTKIRKAMEDGDWCLGLTTSEFEFNLLRKHYGPGIHEGTGTDQSAHGRGGKTVTSASGKKMGVIFDTDPAGPGAESHAIFNAELSVGGETYKSRVMTSYDWEAGTRTDVDGVITDSDGNVIGRFSRELHPNENWAYNASFFMDDEHQGTGVGTMFFSHWEDELGNAGYDRMRVSTAEVGKYAWAIAGYEFEDDSHPQRIIGALEDWTGRQTTKTLYGEASLAQAQDVIDRWNSGGDVSPMDIALIGADTNDFDTSSVRHLGKQFLVGGSNLGWNGVKEIGVSKGLDAARRVWKEWATRNPAAIEQDDPEFLQALKQANDA